MGTSDGTVIGTTSIVDNGSPTERYNLVIVSEGYQDTPADMMQFANDAQQFVDSLFATRPFNELRAAFNVFRIDVTSTDQGADDPVACGGNGVTPATYFDASFCHSGIRRALQVDTSLVIDIVDTEVPEWHQILVIVNTPIWGGTGGSVGVTSKAPGWEGIAIHEFGHSGFGLADEYEYWAGCGIDTNRDNHPVAEPSQPNVTIDSNRATIKWGDLILESTPLPTTSNGDCTRCDPQGPPAPVWECIEQRDNGYWRCDEEEDRGYSRCRQTADLGYRNCCTWWPCSWFCAAWVWISNVVCVAWTWISHIVCIVWTWISHIVCILGRWVDRSRVVGAFEGAHYYHCGAFRPEFHCMMRNNRSFCAVCQRRIRETMLTFL